MSTEGRPLIALMLTTEGMTASATLPNSLSSAASPGMREAPTAGFTAGRTPGAA